MSEKNVHSVKLVAYGYTVDLWWFGALIYITGSIMINLGSNLIRYSHEIVKYLPTNQQPPVWKRFWWLIGMLIFCLGNIFNFFAFMFAAQSLLVALGSIQFISNVIFANFINDEEITKRSLVATTIIILGNIITVMYGSKTTNTYSLSQLFSLLYQPVFLIYYSILTALTILFQSLYFYCKYQISLGNSKPYMQRFIPFAYAAVSAMVGSVSVTLGKALSGIVSATIKNETLTQLRNIWSYIIFFFFIVFTIFWIYRMNTALKNYDALFIIPTLQALWLLFAILGGGIYYQEYLSMSWKEICMFFLGLFILLCGVTTLAPRNSIEMKSMNHHHDDNYGDDESEQHKEELTPIVSGLTRK